MMVQKSQDMTKNSSCFWSQYDLAGPMKSNYDSSRNRHIMTSKGCLFWSQYDFRILKSDGDLQGSGMSDYDSRILWSYCDGIGPAKSGYDLGALGVMA